MNTEVLYDRLNKLIFKTVHQFKKQHGGDLDDLISQANLSFVEACRTHKPEKSQITTWVRNRIWWDLEEMRRQHVREAKRMTCLSASFEQPIKFDTDRLIRQDLTHDAGQAVKTVLGFGKKKQRKKHLVFHLLNSGWSGQRVVSTFQEIREAIA